MRYGRYEANIPFKCPSLWGREIAGFFTLDYRRVNGWEVGSFGTKVYEDIPQLRFRGSQMQRSWCCAKQAHEKCRGAARDALRMVWWIWKIIAARHSMLCIRIISRCSAQFRASTCCFVDRCSTLPHSKLTKNTIRYDTIWYHSKHFLSRTGTKRWLSQLPQISHHQILV